MNCKKWTSPLILAYARFLHNAILNGFNEFPKQSHKEPQSSRIHHVKSSCSLLNFNFSLKLLKALPASSFLHPTKDKLSEQNHAIFHNQLLCGLKMQPLSLLPYFERVIKHLLLLNPTLMTAKGVCAVLSTINSCLFQLTASTKFFYPS